jgi:hypothetical protein
MYPDITSNFIVSFNHQEIVFNQLSSSSLQSPKAQALQLNACDCLESAA